MHKREYPEHPLVGVGGVVISGGRVLLARRGTEPLLGEWSIPGGLLELGETLAAGVARELREETGLTVRAVALIDAFDRIFADPAVGAKQKSAEPKSSLEPKSGSEQESPARETLAVNKSGGASAVIKYHYVLLDYLCEVVSGEPKAGSDATELAFVREEELPQYALAPVTLEVIRKAFAMARARSA